MRLYNQQETGPLRTPISLNVVPGMTVIVKHDYLTWEKAEKDWWMGKVIHCSGAVRAPSIHNPIQIADVDSGVIRLVKADLMTCIFSSKPEQ